MVLEAIRFHRGDGTAKSTTNLEILDQLLLPHRTAFIPVTSVQDAHSAIKKMQVRGAPAIAIVAALALATQLSREVADGILSGSAAEAKELIHERLDYLQTSRPTAVNLGDAVRKLKRISDRAAGDSNASSQSVVTAYVDAAERMLQDDVADNEAIGRHGTEWIEQHTVAGRQRKKDQKQPLQVLTHCNTG